MTALMTASHILLVGADSALGGIARFVLSLIFACAVVLDFKENTAI